MWVFSYKPEWLRSPVSTKSSSRGYYRPTGLLWRGSEPGSIYKPAAVEILPRELRDLEQSWEAFRSPDLHKLSAVDAAAKIATHAIHAENPRSIFFATLVFIPSSSRPLRLDWTTDPASLLS